MNKIELIKTINEEYKGKRLDAVLAKIFPEHSRTRLSSWIKKGVVFVDEENTYRPKDKVKGGEEVVINTVLEDELSFEPENIPIDIVYEDDSIIIINKNKDTVVHPAAGNPSGTLLNALLYHYPDLVNVSRAGIVHRLDKNTTGLMVVAKTTSAHTSLVSQLQARDVKREYLALVDGVVKEAGRIETLVGRHPIHRTKMAVLSDSGKDAITNYAIEKSFSKHTLLKVNLETGRTHQIRVHTAYLKHPIVGDPTYNKAKKTKEFNESLNITINNFNRQALHARKLGFLHPNTGLPVEFFAELPSDFANLCKVIENNQ